VPEPVLTLLHRETTSYYVCPALFAALVVVCVLASLDLPPAANVAIFVLLFGGYFGWIHTTGGVRSFYLRDDGQLETRFDTRGGAHRRELVPLRQYVCRLDHQSVQCDSDNDNCVSEFTATLGAPGHRGFSMTFPRSDPRLAWMWCDRLVRYGTRIETSDSWDRHTPGLGGARGGSPRRLRDAGPPSITAP